MKRLAVTGATGFIGRHVAAELAKYDVEVVYVAHHQSDRPNVSRGRWVNVDLHNPPQNVFEILREPDVVIHLAWEGLPNYKSFHHFESELPGQYAFIKQLVTEGLKSIVAVGTCFEYGMQSGALSEDMETRPANPYALAKDTLHKQLQYLKSAYNFNLIWPRLFYMYGEGQAESSLLSQLCKAVTLGETVFNMSSGEQLRDYLPVSVVAKELVLLSLIDQDMGPINICSGVPISVRNLVEQWIHKNQWNIELNLGYYPYPDYEPFAFWGDKRKMTALLKDVELNSNLRLL